LLFDFIPSALLGPQPIGVRVSNTTPITATVSAVSATAAISLLCIMPRSYSPCL
jgi:hypothetical protein